MIIAFLVYCSLIILGLFFKRNKLLSIILLGYIWVLFALNTDSPDYLSYSNIYFNSDYYLDIELGYRLICKFFLSIGVSYQIFRMLWGGVYIALIANYVFRNTLNANHVLALLLICPAVLEVSGIRSSVAMLIVINCTMFLYKNGWKNKCYFLLGVLGAAFIHSFVIVCVVFVMADKRLPRISIVTFVMVASGLFLALRIPAVAQAAVSVFGGIFPPGKAEKWLLSNDFVHPNFVGIFSVVIFVIFFAVYGYYETRFIKNKIIKRMGERGQIKVIENKYKANRWTVIGNLSLITLFVIPTLFISVEFTRLLHGVLIIYYIISANFIAQVKDKWNRIGYTAVILFAVIGRLGMYIYSYPSHDVFATLYNNMLFSH